MKKGTAVVTAKIKVGKKTYTKKVKVTVTAPKTPAKTNTPLKTEKPTVTETPVVDNTAKPPVTDVPAVNNTIPPATDVPVVNNTPTPGTDATAVPDATATPAPGMTEAPTNPTGESHSVYLTEENAYNSTKGGIVVSTSGATAWGAAFSKFGANYGLTDKKFASVVVVTEFYKNNVKVTPAATNLQLVIASSSDWGGSGEKTADISNGTTTISGTDMVANALVFQWKKAAADITEYDTVIVKSISLVEAPAS